MKEEKELFKNSLRDFSRYGEILENPELSSEQKLKELSKINSKESDEERSIEK